MIPFPGISLTPHSAILPGTKGRAPVWSWFALALPSVAYFALLFGQTENVPLSDDFVTLLPFISSWHEAGSFGGKLTLLWEQCFSHRIIVSRLVAVVVDAVHGDLQLAWVKMIGWVGWLALLGSLVLSQNTSRRSVLIALAAALWLMSPQGTSNMFVAVQAIQYVGALLFAHWALQLSLARTPAAFALAIMLAAGAMGSSANGLLVFPVATLLLCVRGQRKRAVVFAFAGVVAWAAFFFKYHFDSHPFSLVDFLGNATAMLGGGATLGRYGVGVAIPCGTTIGLAALWIVLQPRHWTANPAAVAFLLYVLLSVAMAASARVGWSADYMLQDRYRIYGSLCVVAIGLLGTADATSPRRRFWTAAFVTCGAIYCLASYAVAYPSVLLTGQWSRATAMNRQLDRMYLQPGSEQVWDVAAKNLLQAERAGVYRPPQPLTTEDLLMIRRLRDLSAGDRWKFTAVRSTGELGHVLVPDPTTPALSPPEIVVASYTDGPLLLAVGRMRLPLPQVILQRRFLSDRFACIVPAAVYRRGAIPVHGLTRDTSGHLQVIWSATADCL